MVDWDNPLRASQHRGQMWKMFADFRRFRSLTDGSMETIRAIESDLPPARVGKFHAAKIGASDL
ncbi:MAG TPA: hypothetical protein VIK53_17085 [Verrucomicrobiae bacterium]